MLNSFDKQQVKQLIDFIITMPQEDDEKTGHRFPYMASEVLNCDVHKVNEFFFTTEQEFQDEKAKKLKLEQSEADPILSESDISNFLSENKLDDNIKQNAKYDETNQEENNKEGGSEINNTDKIEQEEVFEEASKFLK